MPKAKKAKKAPTEAQAMKAKGMKLKKDPNKPKGALSAFMYFSSATRPWIKEKSPDMPFGDVAKEVGRLWKELGDDDKAPFVKLAAADKIRWKEAKEAAGE